MNGTWYRDLFSVGGGPIPAALFVRVAVAVGLPLVGFTLAGHPLAGVAGGATAMFVMMCDVGVTRANRVGTMLAGTAAILAGGVIGHEWGGTTLADETVVLLAALLAGWVSNSHPGISAVARFGALATAAGTGLHMPSPATEAVWADRRGRGGRDRHGIRGLGADRHSARRQHDGLARRGAARLRRRGCGAVVCNLFRGRRGGVAARCGSARREQRVLGDAHGDHGDAARGNGQPEARDPICSSARSSASRSRTRSARRSTRRSRSRSPPPWSPRVPASGSRSTRRSALPRSPPS